MSREYEEFIELLNSSGVDYLVVGGYAVGFHSVPRATKDIDIFHASDPESAEALLRVISSFFGTALEGLTAEDLQKKGVIVQLGIAPKRIDLLASLEGISSFNAAWKRRVEGIYGDVRPCYYLSLGDLIKAKTASGREQDLADLVTLKRARKKKKEF